MRISNRELQRWIDFLDAQIVAFDRAYLEKTGEPHVANRPLVAFLKVNDELLRDSVDQAVREFAKANVWPSSLRGDQLVNLTHRAFSGRSVLLAIYNGSIARNAPQLLRMPRPNDRGKLIPWLMNDLWRMSGAAYLEALTKSYLAETL